MMAMKKTVLTIMTCLLGLLSQAQTGSFAVDITSPQYFSVKVPDGNYRVEVVLGGKKNSDNIIG